MKVITKQMRSIRRAEAEQRQADYDKLSLDQKIERATKRGGSKRELERLQAQK